MRYLIAVVLGTLLGALTGAVAALGLVVGLDSGLNSRSGSGGSRSGGLEAIVELVPIVALAGGFVGGVLGMVVGLMLGIFEVEHRAPAVAAIGSASMPVVVGLAGLTEGSTGAGSDRWPAIWLLVSCWFALVGYLTGTLFAALTGWLGSRGRRAGGSATGTGHDGRERRSAQVGIEIRSGRRCR
ncbi:MAG: hypothetical protein ACR2QK_05415 [Acidimicrobiales bacterium]